jgi:hypothetical protein
MVGLLVETMMGDWCDRAQMSREGLKLWNIFEIDVSHNYKLDQIDSESHLPLSSGTLSIIRSSPTVIIRYCNLIAPASARLTYSSEAGTSFPMMKQLPLVSFPETRGALVLLKIS